MNVKCLVVIALYNHAKTIRQVAQGCLKFCNDVLVVDDASTDGGLKEVDELPIYKISLVKNKGKGNAILEAVKFAKSNSFTHIITIDADAQHFSSDIVLFLDQISKTPNSIIIGVRDFTGLNIPAASKFGRKFGGFWVKIQTGKTIADIQSGFRVYPIFIFGKFPIYSKRFDFEVEIIVKALWAGFDVQEIAIKVFYPPKKERVSHFNFFFDNVRLGILNTYLTFRAMIPIPHKKYIFSHQKIQSLNPFKAVLSQLKEKNNPLILGLSGGWAAFCGTLALPGVRNIILLFGVGWWNLNRLVAFSLDKLAMPPFIPFVCIETGYFIRHGHFLTHASWQVIGREFGYRVWEWFLGSLIVAPIFGFLVGLVVFVIGCILRRGLIYGS
ncbi:MAG: glycosyltransferase family 2 protein, partial [Elusimicrobiota bacterium]|nr:glycosyltransferase family 2 protein [Elusimicrobiota bacterium]